MEAEGRGLSGCWRGRKETDMIAIGFGLLGVGLVVALLLALADPLLISRLEGEPDDAA
ncbi:hypothetical protein GCM10009734_48550 [Nonomuraea bangladeshensis]